MGVKHCYYEQIVIKTEYTIFCCKRVFVIIHVLFRDLFFFLRKSYPCKVCDKFDGWPERRQGTGGREQEAGNRRQGTGGREPEAGDGGSRISPSQEQQCMTLTMAAPSWHSAQQILAWLSCSSSWWGFTESRLT